jgi:hypothetical protein
MTTGMVGLTCKVQRTLCVVYMYTTCPNHMLLRITNLWTVSGTYTFPGQYTVKHTTYTNETNHYTRTYTYRIFREFDFAITVTTVT